MDIRELKIFIEVAKELNMTKAAKQIYISQPAVSQAINELEFKLGCKLFDRANKKLFLTQKGEELLIYAKRIIDLKDLAMREIKEKAVLRIGASTTIGIYILPKIIKKFEKDNPNIKINLIIENSSNILKKLDNFEIDYCFIEGDSNNNSYIKDIWKKDELVLICSNIHDFSGKTINKKDLINKRFILREKGSGTRAMINEIFENNKISITNYIEYGNSEAIKRSVEADMGISILSISSVERDIKNGYLSVFSLKDCLFYRVFYKIIHKEKFIDKSLRKFIDYISIS